MHDAITQTKGVLLCCTAAAAAAAAAAAKNLVGAPAGFLAEAQSEDLRSTLQTGSSLLRAWVGLRHSNCQV
jgi:hypothetical protein